jgi:hypothetical protein
MQSPAITRAERLDIPDFTKPLSWPDEIWLNIFAHIPEKNLGKLSLICRKFQILVAAFRVGRGYARVPSKHIRTLNSAAILKEARHELEHSEKGSLKWETASRDLTVENDPTVEIEFITDSESAAATDIETASSRSTRNKKHERKTKRDKVQHKQEEERDVDANAIAARHEPFLEGLRKKHRNRKCELTTCNIIKVGSVIFCTTYLCVACLIVVVTTVYFQVYAKNN